MPDIDYSNTVQRPIIRKISSSAPRSAEAWARKLLGQNAIKNNPAKNTQANGSRNNPQPPAVKQEQEEDDYQPTDNDDTNSKSNAPSPSSNMQDIDHPITKNTQKALIDTPTLPKNPKFFVRNPPRPLLEVEEEGRSRSSDNRARQNAGTSIVNKCSRNSLCIKQPGHVGRCKVFHPAPTGPVFMVAASQQERKRKAGIVVGNKKIPINDGVQREPIKEKKAKSPVDGSNREEHQEATAAEARVQSMLTQIITTGQHQAPRNTTHTNYYNHTTGWQPFPPTNNHTLQAMMMNAALPPPLPIQQDATNNELKLARICRELDHVLESCGVPPEERLLFECSFIVNYSLEQQIALVHAFIRHCRTGSAQAVKTAVRSHLLGDTNNTNRGHQQGAATTAAATHQRHQGRY